MEMLEQDDVATEEVITCGGCGEKKPRSMYRKVANPTICRECYRRSKEKAKMERQNKVIEGTFAEGTSKYRVGVYLSKHSKAVVLGVLSLRFKNDSAVLEHLLQQAYREMSVQEQGIVAYVAQQQSM